MKTPPPPPAPPPRLRILLVDDHAVVRVGLRTILGDDPRLEIAGEAGTGAEALRRAGELRPDVVLLDLRLPDQPGFEVCRQLKAGAAPPAVLVLTSFADDQLVLEAISAGADGYLLKDFEQTALADALVRVARGASVLDPTIARKVLDARRADPAAPVPVAVRLQRLTPQERRTLALLGEGRTNKEIATTMRLSEGTVRNCLTVVFAKLGVASRTEAVAAWLKR
jgi:DNA-binding NarL/FixJ family response regulator